MELDNPKNFPIIMVHWIDSAAPTEGGWYQIDLDHIKEEPLECFSVGFVIAENEERIVICSSYYEQMDGDGIGTLGSISIPMVAITAIEWIYKPEKEKENE